MREGCYRRWSFSPFLPRRYRRFRCHREGGKEKAYVEYSLSLQSAGAGVFLRHGDDFFGEALGFFCFGPGCRY